MFILKDNVIKFSSVSIHIYLKPSSCHPPKRNQVPSKRKRTLSHGPVRFPQGTLSPNYPPPLINVNNWAPQTFQFFSDSVNKLCIEIQLKYDKYVKFYDTRPPPAMLVKDKIIDYIDYSRKSNFI